MKTNISELRPPFPHIIVPDFHTVKVGWYNCQKDLEQQGIFAVIEVTLRPKGKSDWTRIYLGKGRSCIYEDLQGATEYEIRLRYKVGDSYGPYSDSVIFKSPTEPNAGFDLHKAIESENIDTLSALLEKSNKKIEYTDRMDHTPLMVAVIKNKINIIQLLLKYGADVNTANKLGRTALMISSNEGLIDIVDILIQSGAHVNAQDINGMTAIFYAVDGGFSNVIRVLVHAGADVNHQESENGFTPLIRLAFLTNNGNPEVGKTLLERGAVVNQQDKFGRTALIHCAFHQSHNDLAKVLLEYGADPNIPNNVSYLFTLSRINFCLSTLLNYKNGLVPYNQSVSALSPL
ncbi:unnamed protein product [Hymenolepis diminuta]|uniref:Fibronectin type-III domain-containing protein n=3 Tax=Hymenolepis diminuta TaxID=6216 RepID=A0A0R3SRH0_HYMDI|nr:unnamed protein product [Hymenolepis diminuta]